MDALLDSERGPDLSTFVCPQCRVQPRPTSPNPVYRCNQCFHRPIKCGDCTIEDHRLHPLHTLQQWSAEKPFWCRYTLYELGHVLYLGHGGRPCSNIAREPRNVVVVHGDGVDTMRLGFCGCPVSRDGREVDSQQLIRHGFWPGSWHIPLTVYTLDVLDKFSILSHQAHTNAQDFFGFLKRLTDNVAPESVAVSFLTFALRLD